MVIWLLAGCRPIVAPAASSLVQATPVKATDQVLVSQTGDQVTVAVTSTSGIGGLEVLWDPAAPPAALTLQLHLAGLEELRLQAGGVLVQAGVTSAPPYAVQASAQQQIAAEAAPTQLAPGDPFWPEIELVSIDGAQPQIPLQNGYFVVNVPPALLAAGNGRLEVAWIDFYR